MEYSDHPFRVSTGSSRRPTPTAYEHLRTWLEAVSHVLPITSIEQLTNVNQFLEQQATLYISNVIQQVIAQLIGQTDEGFATIKATLDGALHFHQVNPLTELDVNATLQDGDELIGKVKIEGISQPLLTAVIDIPAGATTTITSAAPTGSYHICSIMFTVAGQVNLTLRDETALLSGAMDFGGTDEPRGMTHSFGRCPLKCAAGKKFQIVTLGDYQVSGLITFYDA